MVSGASRGYVPPITGADFTYTGNYILVDDENNNWRLKFITSGVFTPVKDILVDIFLVGAGAGGGGGTSSLNGGGGGSGYVGTHKSIVLYANVSINVIIGAGGAGGVNAVGSPGGSTSFGTFVVNGGGNGAGVDSGGSGGSGGGVGGSNDALFQAIGGNGGNGGSNGASGNSSNKTSGTIGIGSNISLTEFGEDGAELYSGAGGGACGYGNGGPGLAGNGGAGGTTSLSAGGGIVDANTGIPSPPSVIGGISPQTSRSGGGGGGYGGGGGGSGSGAGGAGCQGIVIIRNHRAA